MYTIFSALGVRGYASYLKQHYKPKQQDRYGDCAWPPPVTDKFKVFKLAMIKAKEIVSRRDDELRTDMIKKTSRGNLDHIKEDVELKDVFKGIIKGQQKKILLQGGPGSGKSTICLHICHEWRRGELFKDYRLAILVKLRDREVQKATDIAGILPREDDKMGRDAVKAISAINGKDVLFVFDGWDELPQSSPCYPLIMDILEGNKLSDSAIIVTSRPDFSQELQEFVGSRIEILGFTQEELQRYFAECLGNKTEDVEALVQKIRDNPRVAGSCHLPLNASIIVHLFKCNKSLPSTEYGIFYELICSHIVRDHKKKGNGDIEVESLDKLPDKVQKSFNHLCKVAYDGVKEEKIIFDKADLGTNFKSLGLLQGEQSFSTRGKSQSYHFVHLSVQEVLTAIHMAIKLSETEQVEEFNNLFGQPRFYAVFRYFAAITKLKNPGIKQVVSQVAKKQFRTAAKDNSADSMFGYTYQSELVTLLHCLFEAKDDDLCEEVVQQLNSQLNLDSTSLNPTDCLSVGFFLTYCQQFSVSLEGCYISDEGCKMLFSQNKGYPFRILKYVFTAMIYKIIMSCRCIRKCFGLSIVYYVNTRKAQKLHYFF